MKKIRRCLAALLAAAALCTYCPAARAVFEDFTDTSGHWAEETLRRAWENGLISGYADGMLGPDDPISKAQICAVLCRVLGALEKADASEVGLTGDEWYADAAAKALYLGLITPDEPDLAGPVTRAAAFCMVAEAFQLAQGDPDLKLLDAYEDARTLTREQKRAVASLLAAGFIQGGDSGLMLTKTITRAEFLTVLDRINGTYADELQDGAEISGGAMILSSGTLRNVDADRLWLGCACPTADLVAADVGLVVLRSDSLAAFSISGFTAIDRLVLAARSERTLLLAPNGMSTINTVVVGTGSGDINISGGIKNAEVTGDGRNVTLSAPYGSVILDKLVISGDGCSVTVSGNVTVQSAVIYGRDDSLIVEGTVNGLDIEGRGAAVSGSGTTKTVTVLASACTVSTRFTTLTERADEGIEDAFVSLSAADAPAAGEPLPLSAEIAGGAEDAQCTASWYEDGRLITEQTVALTDGKAKLNLLHEIEYEYGMDTNREYTIRLTCTTESGEMQEKAASACVTLSNFGKDYYASQVPVRCVYEGDYTTQWAIDNDYPAYVKEYFVNKGGWSSGTEYLIWISSSRQHVNVFTGSQGGWTLARSFLCSTGTEQKPSPQGVFTVYGVLGKWVFPEYWCYNILGFYFGSDYAFHSRPYRNGTFELYDASIGFPASHGCIRMYDDDVRWLIDNIPVNTTVLSY